MDADDERELDAIISEEKAKIVLGSDYDTLDYDDWVDALEDFVATQHCDDCGSGYDLDEPDEEMWGWYMSGDEADGVEQLEVVQFYCKRFLQLPESERQSTHHRSWGVLIFRRSPTGTFPLDDE